MKSKKNGLSLVAITLSLWLAAAQCARAADADGLPIPTTPNDNASGDTLPAPNTGDEDKSAPEPQAAIPEPIQTGNNISNPDADLPAPIASDPTEDPRNQVNKTPTAQTDDVFLPAPVNQAPVEYTPLGNPVANTPSSIYEPTEESEHFNSQRPNFSLDLGAAIRQYPSDFVTGAKIGEEVGASYRVLTFWRYFDFKAYASASFIGVGNLGVNSKGQQGNYHGINDDTIHWGGVIDLNLGNRFSVFGSLLHRSNTLSANPESYPQDVNQLNYIRESSSFRGGFGAQLDLYVIPHGSFGIMGYFEPSYGGYGSYGSVMLTMSLEPQPGKNKLSLEDDTD